MDVSVSETGVQDLRVIRQHHHHHQEAMGSQSMQCLPTPCKKRPLSWCKPPSSPSSSSTTSSHSDDDSSPTKVPLLWTGCCSSPESLSPSHRGFAVCPTNSNPILGGHQFFFPVVPSMLQVMAKTLVRQPENPTMPSGTQAPRKKSDFSIEHILRDAGSVSRPKPEEEEEEDHSSALLDNSATSSMPDGHFEWLQCTRYRPPKLPRSRRRDGPTQRRLGRNPRIPFSPQQVLTLEERFKRSHYLSSADVAELSTQLELSQTRVKIWFQNRRARERRDGGMPIKTEEAQTAAAQKLSSPTPSTLRPSPASAFTDLRPVTSTESLSPMTGAKTS